MLQYLRNIVVLVILLRFHGILRRADALNLNEECKTPNNETGVCIQLGDCKSILEMLQTNLTAKGRRYLTDSQCGNLANETDATRKVLVCCGLPKPEEESGVLSLLPKPKECGFQFTNRIFGGSMADPADYPWMALIFYKKMNGQLTTNCAGSLINPRYILSAAHCVKNPSVPSSLTVHSARLGEFNLDTAPDCYSNSTAEEDCLPLHKDYLIEEIIVHELYQTRAAHQFHDISLLRLAENVEYSSYIKPICLPLDLNLQEKEYINVSTEIAGWGSTETSYTSNTKMKATVTVFPLEKCQEKFSTYGIHINTTQLCAGGEDNKDTCRGDSGGPLMVTEKNVYYAAGIVSYGAKPCGLMGWPGVYTRVGYYIPWILEHIKP